MILENVRSGSKRETDGSLPKKPSEKKSESGILVKAKKSIGKQLDDVPVFDLSGLGKKLNIDSLVDVNNLLTVQGYEKLYQTADSSFLYWKSELKTRTYLDRAAQLEKKIKQLKLEEIKDVPGLTSALTKVNNIQKDMKSLRTEVQEKHSGFSNTFARLQKDLTAVQNNLKKDINRAKQLARLKDLDVKDVSLLLFGAPVVSTSAGSIPEVLSADTGWCAVPGDDADLAARLRELAANPEAAEKKRGNARRLLESRFDATVSGRRRAALFAEVVGPG